MLVPPCRSGWSTNAPWDGAGSKMSHIVSSSTPRLLIHSAPMHDDEFNQHRGDEEID
jgi:hypothetical protein